MQNYGGANWDYELIKAEYFRMENYTGPVRTFGRTGEVSILIFFFFLDSSICVYLIRLKALLNLQLYRLLQAVPLLQQQKKCIH
jgi:hypothetical protein